VPEIPAPVTEPQTPVAAHHPQKPKKQKAVPVKPPAASKQAKPPKPAHQPPYEPRTSDDAATALSEWLSQHSSVWQDFQPLSIGVVREVYRLLEIHGMQEAWSKRVVHKTLFWHTTRTQYVQNIQQGTHRFSLNGQIAGEISTAQREYAENQLKRKNHHKKRKK
jgi:ProQ/FINO family.